jgi:hypothetical protein
VSELGRPRHSILRNYWISRFLKQAGAVPNRTLPDLGVKIRSKNGKLNGSDYEGETNAVKMGLNAGFK